MYSPPLDDADSRRTTAAHTHAAGTAVPSAIAPRTPCMARAGCAWHPSPPGCRAGETLGRHRAGRRRVPWRPQTGPPRPVRADQRWMRLYSVVDRPGGLDDQAGRVIELPVQVPHGTLSLPAAWALVGGTAGTGPFRALSGSVRPWAGDGSTANGRWCGRHRSRCGLREISGDGRSSRSEQGDHPPCSGAPLRAWSMRRCPSPR